MFAGVLLLSAPAGSPAAQSPSHRAAVHYLQHGFDSLDPGALKAWIDAIGLPSASETRPVIFDEPVEGSLYPPDLASPAFLWYCSELEPQAWLLRFAAARGDLFVIVNRPWWVPTQEQWELLKQLSGYETVGLDAYGIGGWRMRSVIAAGRTAFSISPDPVESPLAFIRKPLPFSRARENPQQSRLLLADLGSYGHPKTLLEKQGACFNCHGFAARKNVFGMDLDASGDKGGYILKAIRPGANRVTDADIISWNDIPAPAPAEVNMGLFARLSPDGRFVAATVGESSVFVMIDDLYFSQLFFPASGRIACFDLNTRKMFLLPGADLPGFIQTGPEWSPDGRFVYFARAPLSRELLDAVLSGQVKNESSRQRIGALNQKYPIRFDIWRVPFNAGSGGEAVPVEGASANGMSNYFPRVSPDGKWIVFTQSPTGMVLQPGSRLRIVAAAGGSSRELGCKTTVMNSWHSWSPNGKWLAYASKVQSPFTEIFLTHIDASGRASPGIRLFRLSASRAAAMVPEFAGPGPMSLDSLVVRTRQPAEPVPASGNVR